MWARCRLALGSAAAAMLLAGCAMPPRLGMPPPGPPPSVAADQPPVVFIHGSFGSRLVEAGSGREVWPGGFFKLLFGRYSELALDIDAASLRPAPDHLVVQGLFDHSGAIDYYRSLLRSLRSAGYREGSPGVAVTDSAPRYYALLYDWRYDNLGAVRALDALIAQIRRDHGRPDLKVDLVAHSNGGLIARYYARYGTADLDGGPPPVTREGAARLRRVVLIGTPNLGMLESLIALTRGEEIGLRRVRPEIIATFAGSYALLPAAGSGWLLDARGRRVEREAHDPVLWRELRLGVFNPEIARRVMVRHGGGERGAAELRRLERYVEAQLQRGGRLSRALAQPADEGDIEPIVLGGDCTPTPARVVVETVERRAELRFEPDEIYVRPAGIDYPRAMYAPGDGTVTRASALGSREESSGGSNDDRAVIRPFYSMFLCARHNQLTADPHFHDNLLDALLVR